jgi:hypothetical protein
MEIRPLYLYAMSMVSRVANGVCIVRTRNQDPKGKIPERRICIKSKTKYKKKKKSFAVTANSTHFLRQSCIFHTFFWILPERAGHLQSCLLVIIPYILPNLQKISPADLIIRRS